MVYKAFIKVELIVKNVFEKCAIHIKLFGIMIRSLITQDDSAFCTSMPNRL